MRRRMLTALAIAAGLLAAVLPATAAAAHVEIAPPRAAAGSSPRVVFEVPNEVAGAATTAVEVYLPATPAVPAAAPVPVPGWSARVLTASLATPLEFAGRRYGSRVTRVTWTATGKGITGTAAGRFPVVLGPLPPTDRLVFKVLQRYSNGQVARWIDEPTAGPEPEHPAPVLTVLPGKGPVPAAPGASAVASGVPTRGAPTVAPTPAARTGGRTGSAVAMVAAALAVAAVAAAAWLYRRRSAT